MSAITSSEPLGPRRFGRALKLQGIVIWAVMMREIHTRYGRENLGFLWLLFEPLMFALGVLGIWSMARESGTHSISLVGFVLTGYVPVLLWRHIVSRSVYCFRSNAHLLYHRQVRMLDLLVGRYALELCSTIMTFAVLGFVFGVAGYYDPPEDYGLFYLGWLYAALFPIGLGMIIGCLTEQFEWLERLVGPLSYFYLPLSGAFFMVDWLPARAQKYATLNPSVDSYEMIRAGQFGARLRVHYDVGYTTLVCVALIVIGLLLCRRVHRHLMIN